MEKIDFVITWVDGSDPEWLLDREKYITSESTAKKDIAGTARYQDNGLLRYWFRGVEKFAPWVNKIYFVTYGHLPNWLDVNNPKLVIVNHKDFLKKEWLPTFSSVPLNLNLHKINGLSEKFVYFNDDMFLVSPCKSELFFKDGLPCDMAVQDVIPATEISAYWHMVYNDIICLNTHCKKKISIKKYWKKWFSPIYGKNLIKNILLSPLSMFTGIYETHLPAGYLKSSYEKVWDLEPKLEEVSTHKVRTLEDISENFIRYFQMANGNFTPINKLKYGRYCSMSAKNIVDYVSSGKYKYLCINDEVQGKKFERIKKAFESILPEKSSFEK